MTGKTTSIVRGFSASTQTDQGAAAARIGGIGREQDFRCVFEDRERFLSFEQRNVIEMPATLLVNRHRHDFKSTTVQMSDYGRSRLKRNFMFS
jgi:hypothetical protein